MCPKSNTLIPENIGFFLSKTTLFTVSRFERENPKTSSKNLRKGTKKLPNDLQDTTRGHKNLRKWSPEVMKNGKKTVIPVIIAMVILVLIAMVTPVLIVMVVWTKASRRWPIMMAV